MDSDKTYRIGEVARMLQLKSYVLRFWETEFPQLSPSRTDKGQRLYTEKDVELLRAIRHLLHERGLTIDGARKELAAHSAEADLGGLLEEIRQELLAMRSLLLQAENAGNRERAAATTQQDS